MGTFEKILRNGIDRGHIPGKSESAKKWYRDAAQNFKARIRGDESRVDYARSRNINKQLMNEYRDRQQTKVKVGSMYMYFYDPKYKDTLPFYDRFPLIFPFRVEPGRFWGLNFHYLSLPLRAKLLDSLEELSNNKRYDDTTKLNISWKLLTAVSKNDYYAPCVKQYLISHTRSKFLLVKPEEWQIALFLPTESFVKSTKSQVWSDSKKKLGVTK